jgi:hypothetical protein
LILLFGANLPWPSVLPRRGLFISSRAALLHHHVCTVLSRYAPPHQTLGGLQVFRLDRLDLAVLAIDQNEPAFLGMDGNVLAAFGVQARNLATADEADANTRSAEARQAVFIALSP